MRHAHGIFISILAALGALSGCGNVSTEGARTEAADSCNRDLLRICLQNGGGDVGCQQHRGQNNCSAADVAQVKGSGGAAAATATSGYIWPTTSRNVTSRFGPRRSPCAGCSSYHYGIDIGIVSGSSVFATNAGNSAGTWSGCGGRALKISGNGVATRYLHLSSFVAEGKYVGQGQVVARSGNTGSCTTGPHLHFEFHKNGVPVNPLTYLN